MSPDVALVQNYLGLDGRSQTLVSVVELLNERGIRPDILTFSGEDDTLQFRSLSRFELDFALRTCPRPRLLVGDLMQELAIPYLFRSRLKDYDLAFTSNTAIYGYPEDLRILRLVCFPQEQVRYYESRYIEDPAHRLFGLMHSLALKVASRGFQYHGHWLANSEFTRDVMLQTYPLASDDIEVIYAPVDTRIRNGSQERDRAVVSIGGFHPDKRQLDQIELARQLPDLTFHIMGSVRSVSYYRRCMQTAGGLANVRIVANANREEIEAVLHRAKVFLHTKQNEHFGIGTAEGIAHGCVPVVHDSGGQREIVPFPQLRFKDAAEAKVAVSVAAKGGFDHLLPKLQAGIQAFDDYSFKQRMGQILDGALNSEVTR